MFQYALKPLLTVREFRENLFKNELNVKKKKVEVAQNNFNKKKDEFKKYHNWRILEEKHLFDDIKNKNISPNDLEQYKQTVLKLREKEDFKKKELEEAEQKLNDALEELEDSKIRYNKALKDKRKIEIHKEIWLKEKLVEYERDEEKELEEFKVRKEV